MKNTNFRICYFCDNRCDIIIVEYCFKYYSLSVNIKNTKVGRPKKEKELD